MNEEWRAISGTHSEYWVSSLGRVMSKKRGRTWILKPIRAGNYLSVDLCVQGVHRTALVHRLVAEAFIPNECGYPEVNHRTARERNVQNKRKIVQQLDPITGAVIQEYPSLTAATKAVGCGINNCVTGRNTLAHGYQWRYKEV